jgi:hypothetical protein
VTYGPSGNCGGPIFDISTTAHGYGNRYGYEVNGNSTLPPANTSTPLPGQPAVVDQPFGAGHAILIGFDPWFRAWTLEEERLVLNGVLYPTGSAIPPSSVVTRRRRPPPMPGTPRGRSRGVAARDHLRREPRR